MHATLSNMSLPEEPPYGLDRFHAPSFYNSTRSQKSSPWGRAQPVCLWLLNVRDRGVYESNYQHKYCRSHIYRAAGLMGLKFAENGQGRSTWATSWCTWREDGYGTMEGDEESESEHEEGEEEEEEEEEGGGPCAQGEEC